MLDKFHKLINTGLPHMSKYSKNSYESLYLPNYRLLISYFSPREVRMSLSNTPPETLNKPGMKGSVQTLLNDIARAVDIFGHHGFDIGHTDSNKRIDDIYSKILTERGFNRTEGDEEHGRTLYSKFKNNRDKGDEVTYDPYIY